MKIDQGQIQNVILSFVACTEPTIKDVDLAMSTLDRFDPLIQQHVLKLDSVEDFLVKQGFVKICKWLYHKTNDKENHHFMKLESVKGRIVYLKSFRYEDQDSDEPSLHLELEDKDIPVSLTADEMISVTNHTQPGFPREIDEPVALEGNILNWTFISLSVAEIRKDSNYYYGWWSRKQNSNEWRTWLNMSYTSNGRHLVENLTLQLFVNTETVTDESLQESWALLEVMKECIFEGLDWEPNSQESVTDELARLKELLDNHRNPKPKVKPVPVPLTDEARELEDAFINTPSVSPGIAAVLIVAGFLLLYFFTK